MKKNYDENSWTKGEQFENFVQNIIFPESHYELLHKTNDYKQNTERYVQSSLKPDFQFKSKVTGKKLYVEAKFRSKTFQSKYDVLSQQQFKSFPELNSDDSPIFIAFGYGGKANNPDFISLIPFEEAKERSLSPEKVHAFNITKELFPISEIKQKFKEDKKAEYQEKFEGKIKIPSFKETKKPKNTDPKILIAACIGVVAILLSFYAFSFSTEPLAAEDQLKEIVKDYCQSMNSNQIEKLPKFLSPNVISWYGATDPSLNEILKIAKNHRGKYPFSSSEIDWDSFKVVEQEDGDYYVSYKMIYKSKKKITDDYNVFNLKLVTYWDENYKLKSIREIRL
ncbi:hypothetical protein [Salegentibacter sediminis]|uniref:hypothetical protein n=1 Tax=Salegentibacter sediminis TaxID=1930251 RepID=UPI0009BD63E3|nr:hypothetical protein [Salegentibacter sediminis]